MKRLLFALAMLVGLNFSSQAQEELSQAAVRQDLEAGVVSFTNGVKAALPNMPSNYEQFRLQLVGEQNTATITAEGNALLMQTFEFIRANATDDRIRTEGLSVFAKATKVVLEHEAQLGQEGWSGNTLNAGSVHLFGGHAEGVMGYRAAPPDDCGEYRDCAWYQVGCHLHNIIVWTCRNKRTVDFLITVVKVVAIFI